MRTVKVWDAAVRLFHWALAALVLAAFLTAESDDTIGWHARAGIAVAGLLVFRVIWGVLGPQQARFRSFVRGPREVLAYVRDYVRGRPPVHVSHNPLGALMVVTLLAVLVGTVVTGALTYGGAAWDGPFSAWIDKGLGHDIKEVHEALAGALLFLVPAHVVGVIVSSLLEKQNLVKAMITGQKRATADEVAEPARWPRLLAATALGVVAAWGAFQLLRPGEARADVPSAQALLRSYAAEARAADPAFAAFSAEAGRTLYLREFPARGKSTSCATCHTADPRKPGKTPAGKNLDPLSPAAEPTRFSDVDEVEKWFGRNCKQVIGRACTAREKGDILTWLVAP